MATHARNFLFPAPAYILMPAFGIDISDRSIKYVELVPRGKGYRLGAYGEVPLNSGIVEMGKIVDPKQLQKALTIIAEKNNVSFVRAALPEEQIYLFRMRVPDGTTEEMRVTIELSLEEHIPLAALDTVFDFEVVERTTTDVEVAVTAASRILIENYTDTFKAAGMTLLSLELEAEATTRAVTIPHDPVARMIIDFGETRTGIAVSCGGSVLFTSTIPIGGQMLEKALIDHFKISPEEAQKMKQESGLRRNAPNQDVFSILLNNVAVLRDEINRHFIYWHTHPDENGKPHPVVEEVLLVGGESNLPGFADYLSKSLRIQTKIADVWCNVAMDDRHVPVIPLNYSLGYATAVGLALHDIEYE